MTCIVGLKHKNTIYMGGDSAGVGGLSLIIRADEKVFNVGQFLIGYTSSFRMGQLLRYKLNVPKQSANKTDMEYLVTDFIDSIRALFKDNGFGCKDGQSGGTFLLGYKNNLYQIQNDYQVIKSLFDFDAVGCGDDIALGSMYSTQNKKPKERIRMALEASSKFNAGVHAPFLILDRTYR